MTKDLIPIIAAYLNQKCSYKTLTLDCSDGTLFDGWEISNISHLQNFKLHLRPLWSITEAELRELFDEFHKAGNACQIRVTETEKACYYTKYRDGYYSPYYIFRTGPILELIDITSSLQTTQQVELINHLRSKGFCVDQCLIDAGLVQWKEANNG